MKKIMSLFLIFCAAAVPAGPSLPFKEFKAEAVPAQFKAGTPVKITVKLEAADGFSLRASRLFCYQSNVPAAFFERPGLKITKSKEKEYTSAAIQPWKWFGQAISSGPFTLNLDTKGWPEGDYSICLQGIFRGPDKKDLYRSTDVNFSITKE